MEIHKWADFSNPRNRRVRIQGCVKCGALKSKSSSKGVRCRNRPLENNSLIRMGWIVVGAENIGTNALAKVLGRNIISRELANMPDTLVTQG